MSRLAVIGLLASLGVCSCISAPIDPQMEASAMYQSGYNDGCATSKARSKVFDQTVVRNDTAYTQDQLYKRGWNTGFRVCGSPATQADPTSEQKVQWHSHGPLG